MDLEVENIQNFWQKYFGDCPPVSYLFKYHLNDRWFRVHSLPESKRYAENEIEVAELLKRQNLLLADLTGNDSDCFLICGNYSESPLEDNLKQCSALANFNFQKFVRLCKQDFNPDELEPNEEPVYLSLFFAPYKFKEQDLDEVLLCVAEEKIVNLFVVNFEHQRIFAPYDGGVDVVLANSAERDKFKSNYKSWLSNHPSGF